MDLALSFFPDLTYHEKKPVFYKDSIDPPVQELESLVSRPKSPDAYPWHIFKELEDSLNLIEDFDQIARNFLGKIKESLAVESLALLIYDQDLGKFRVSAFMGGPPGSRISPSRAPIPWLSGSKSTKPIFRPKTSPASSITSRCGKRRSSDRSARSSAIRSSP